MNQNNGFTLIELMVTVLVLAVSLSLAAPSFKAMVQDKRQDTYLTSLRGALRFARSEAIKCSSPVSICARNTDTTCGVDWSEGVLVFSDSLDDGSALDFDGTDVLLRLEALENSEIEVAATARLSAGKQAVSAIRFNGRGEVNWQNGTFVLCDERGIRSAHGLVVARSGLSRDAYGKSESSGVVLDADGNEVSC